MPQYDGFEELKLFLEQNKKPRFKLFCEEYAENITTWSTDLFASEGSILYGIWLERYKELYTIVKNKDLVEKVSHDSSFWKDILDDVKRRKIVTRNLKEKAIDLLGSAATPAAKEISDILLASNHSDIDVPQNTMPIPSNTHLNCLPEHPSPVDQLASSTADSQHHQGSTSASTSSSSNSVHTTPNSSPKLEQPSKLDLQLHDPGPDRFCVDGADISQRFYDFQKMVFEVATSSPGLTMESDTHLILALSSILLLQKNNRMHPAMKSFFGGKLYHRILKHCQTELDMTKTFPRPILVSLFDAAERVSSGDIDRVEACSRIFDLIRSDDCPVDDLDKKLLISITRLLLDLPLNPMNTVMNESELITGYLLPALTHLFQDDDMDVRMRWTATEAADTTKTSVTKKLPDCLVTLYPDSTEDGVNVAYGEVKREGERKNHYLANKDLVRLALFAKGTVDDSTADTAASMAIHAVGRGLTFYLVKIQAEGIYTMAELAHLDVPMAISDIPSYLTKLSTLKNVLHVFYDHCAWTSSDNSASSYPLNWHRPSLSSEDETTIMASKNRKRKNYTGYDP
ncbi:hypothetical protein DM01DRAFT_1326214 [Hesseltinella vesiculosa]|uniref:Uncharacterized protein n=1 Tax=Hesseltinella vesiculosa TaxID=101127 RepID=A0A1X2G9I3_9FUNG|nr:hypothetical protein DM01DRAFT_1326214 [Hesseltinella vesiculosa]